MPNQHEVIHEGPYFSTEDLEPYIVKHKANLISCVAGRMGLVNIRKDKYGTRQLYARNGTRVNVVVFDRGEEVALIKREDKYIIVNKTWLTNREKQLKIPIYGY